METKLTELVIQYKKNKDNKILNTIFLLLEKNLKEKADYVFYQQNFFGKKGIKLSATKKVDYDDIKQELYYEILKIINTYDTKFPFENYLFSSLKFWKPSIINTEFFKNLNTQSIYQINEEGEEENIAENIMITNPQKIEFIEDLTNKEREIFDLLKSDINLTQIEIAEELGISQQRVSDLIASIKKKIQK